MSTTTSKGTAPTVFFAYPSQPPQLAETIHSAVEQIRRSCGFPVKGWKDCRIGGNLIMREICEGIAQANILCADVTGVNFNVMFELGFAIARNKRVWLTLDDTREGARDMYDRFGLLAGVEWRRSCNSRDIVSAFFRDKPFADPNNTLLEQAIKPSLAQALPGGLLYLKALYETDAGIRVTRTVENSRRRGARVVVDDPKESAVQTMSWYGSQIFACEAVLLHLTGPGRQNAELHSARQALVAGMAFGLDKPLLLLAEGDLVAPVDYSELVRRYVSADEAAGRLQEWLPQIERLLLERAATAQSYGARLQLATELRNLQFGEYVAENEEERLVDGYFVRTIAFQEALAGGFRLFVGRKGSGKTANFLKLSGELKANRQNLVCEVKPAAYDFHGVMRLLDEYRRRDAKGYAVESLWKLLLYSELANAAVVEMQRAGRTMSADEGDLATLVEREMGGPVADFGVRLERSVEALLRAEVPAGVESAQVAISEALHQGRLGQLRTLLASVLVVKRRIFVLVDNLDKPWDRDSDLETLSEFLLGLLTAAGSVRREFQRQDNRRQAADVNLILFLRSDIFQMVLRKAREPDKISHSKLAWEDPEALVRVIEERFAASHGGEVEPSALWQKYFCSTVTGVDTKTYILARTLPRPRDLIYFVKACVAAAVNRGHAAVEQADVAAGEKQYSQFALQALASENGAPSPGMEHVLYEFAGCPAVLSEAEASEFLRRGGVKPNQCDELLTRLCSLGFLGVEVGLGDFRFAEDPAEHARNLTLARKYRQPGAGLRLRVHPAFWSFLEVKR